MMATLCELDMDAEGIPLAFRSGMGVHVSAVLGLARMLVLAGTAIEEGHGDTCDGEAVRIIAECIEAHAQRATWLYVQQEEAKTCAAAPPASDGASG